VAFVRPHTDCLLHFLVFLMSLHYEVTVYSIKSMYLPQFGSEAHISFSSVINIFCTTISFNTSLWLIVVVEPMQRSASVKYVNGKVHQAKLKKLEETALKAERLANFWGKIPRRPKETQVVVQCLTRPNP